MKAENCTQLHWAAQKQNYTHVHTSGICRLLQCSTCVSHTCHNLELTSCPILDNSSKHFTVTHKLQYFQQADIRSLQGILQQYQFLNHFTCKTADIFFVCFCVTDAVLQCCAPNPIFSHKPVGFIVYFAQWGSFCKCLYCVIELSVYFQGNSSLIHIMTNYIAKCDTGHQKTGFEFGHRHLLISIA